MIKPFDTVPEGAAYFYTQLDATKNSETEFHIREGYAYGNTPKITKLSEDETGTLYQVGDRGTFLVKKDGGCIWQKL